MKEIAVSSVFEYNGQCMAGANKNTDNAESQEDRFLAAFDAYGDALFRHAFLRLSDRERAIDAVHDTFTKVWSYVRSGQTIDNFRPFLYKVLNNLIVDEYRKQREQSLDAMFEKEGIDEGSFPDLSESTVESLAATIDGKQAFAVLQELPDPYREIIVLRFVDELGPKEIAELIEESENVVSVRLHRGLHMLRDIMQQKEATITANRNGST